MCHLCAVARRHRVRLGLCTDRGPRRPRLHRGPSDRYRQSWLENFWWWSLRSGTAGSGSSPQEKPIAEKRRRTLNDLPDRADTSRARYPLPKGKTDWARLEAMTDEEAHRNALADPDNPPLTEDQLSRMRRVPNPREIRDHLGLSQREFAKQFEIALGTIRDWEQGARRPDSTARANLRVIQHNPEVVLEALGRSRKGAISATG